MPCRSGSPPSEIAPPLSTPEERTRRTTRPPRSRWNKRKAQARDPQLQKPPKIKRCSKRNDPTGHDTIGRHLQPAADDEQEHSPARRRAERNACSNLHRSLPHGIRDHAMTPSVASWRRLAPRATRIAVSRARSTDRAKSKPAAFPHVIRNSSPAAAKSSKSVGRISWMTVSLRSIRRAVYKGWPAGSSAAISTATRFTSASADANVTPGFRRA